MGADVWAAWCLLDPGQEMKSRFKSMCSFERFNGIFEYVSAVCAFPGRFLDGETSRVMTKFQVGT